MASPEGNRTTGEKIGRGVVYTGVVVGLLGTIGWLAEVPLGKEAAIGGGALALSGVIFEKVAGRKK